jgi:hypothetical protein
MTQTATFVDLESRNDLSTQGILYFGATMGTLTEVDLITSGAFTSQLSAENTGPSGQTVTGTTSGNLSINVPTGSIPVSIPAVKQSFNASPFDGVLNDGGSSGKTMAPVTSSSTPQETVLTSPADLAAFTGHFDIPITVSGHATGSITPNDGTVSGSFKTDTTATITVIYHYTGDPPAPSPSSGGPTPAPNGGGTSATNTGTGAVPGTSHIQAAAGQSKASAHHAKKHAAAKTHKPAPHRHPHPVHSPKAGQVAHSRHHGPGSGILS